jgi:hypothetical protein
LPLLRLCRYSERSEESPCTPPSRRWCARRFLTAFGMTAGKSGRERQGRTAGNGRERRETAGNGRERRETAGSSGEPAGNGGKRQESEKDQRLRRFPCIIPRINPGEMRASKNMLPLQRITLKTL